MKDHPNAEQVTNGFIASLQVLEVDYFRSHIAWRPTSYKHKVFVAVLSQSKVSNHAVEVAICPHQNVLRLQVAVHDVVLVHYFQSFKNALHHSFCLMRGKFVLSLNFVVQLSALKQLDADVYRILRLVDLFQSHQIFMAEFPHNVNLIDERFSPILFRVSAFFRECLDCIFFAILVLVDQINCSEVSLANLLDRLEELMEASHVDFLGKHVSPS